MHRLAGEFYPLEEEEGGVGVRHLSGTASAAAVAAAASGLGSAGVTTPATATPATATATTRYSYKAPDPFGKMRKIHRG